MSAGPATSTIGTRQRRIEGLDKSSGRAVYTDDISLPGMLHGKILRSPHPHARIVSIDTAKAEAMEGVHAVVTGADMPVLYGIIPWTPDEYPLCVDRVRFVGDGVAAVAAVDEDTAIRALEVIDVEYEELPAFLDPRASLAASGESPFIHEPRKSGQNGNVTKHVRLEFGKVDSALETAHTVVEGDYFFEGTTHTPIEPHCAIGRWDPDGEGVEGERAAGGGSSDERTGLGGRLTVWSATQVPHYLHRELARVLGLDQARVRVIQPMVGGAFGGKSEPFDLEFCVAKLAMTTGRPVKILYTREEVFYAHRGRHPFHMRYRVGSDGDGRLVGVDAEILLDGGAYASFGLVTTYYSGQLLCAPYRMPAYRFDSTRVYTNKPACGPKRGHGSVQPRFAFEVQLDKLAERLSVDPIELRRRNLMAPGERTLNELRVTSNGFGECLDAVERASEWCKKYRQLPFGRGVGVAGSTYISGTNYPIYPNELPQSAIQMQIDRSGRVAVFSGASEIGQGCDSMVAYVAAEELGVPLHNVRVMRGDTDFTPVDLGAYSSRVTFMLGNAALDAAGKLKKLVQEAVAEHWNQEMGATVAGAWNGRISTAAREGNGRVATSAGPLAEARAGSRDGPSRASATGATPSSGQEPSGARHNGASDHSSSGRPLPSEILLAGGYAMYAPDTALRMPVREAFRLAEARFGTLTASGWYNTPKDVHGEYRGGTIGASPAYSFTAHVAEVEVDAETGVVEVLKIWVAHDCGRALNPVLVEGQMEGSAYMGFAEAIMEEHVFRDAEQGRAGLLTGPSLLDYRIPTSLDTPEFESLIIESLDPEGPYGAKEAGEGPLHPSIPAIANAIHDAVGVRMDSLPFSPPRVWRALREAEEKGDTLSC